MPELREALYVLVEHPPATPTPVELLVARGDGFKRRRRLLRVLAAVAFVGVPCAAGVAVWQQSSAPELIVAAEGSTSAGYIAEQSGGYVATGTWRLTITRGNEVIELASPSSPPCGATGTIQAGDEVRGSITGPNSSLRAGERFSCPTDQASRMDP